MLSLVATLVRLRRVFTTLLASFIIFLILHNLYRTGCTDGGQLCPLGVRPGTPTILDEAGPPLTENALRFDSKSNQERSKPSTGVVCSNKVAELSCKRLFEGDLDEYEAKKSELGNLTQYNLNLTAFLESSYTNTMYCSEFKSRQGYQMEPLSEEEADFPIAYSIMVFTEVELFERLLRAIYRPQNVYCIHVDKSSDAPVQRAVRAIVKCFDNVFTPIHQVDVVYTKFSSLEADLVCMRELLRYKKWKYLINLTGQEFPLQSSLALVKILKALNGTNSVEGLLLHGNRDRYRNAGAVPVPGMVLTKGAVHIAATRAFIDYAVNNYTAMRFLDWVAKTEEPDETYFSALHHSPRLGVPGAYLGYPNSKREEYPFLARFKNWIGSLPCRGKYVRTICVLGVGDLPLLAKRKEMFLNKFNGDFEPAAYACMEELLCNRTKEELNGSRSINITYYSSLVLTKFHLK